MQLAVKAIQRAAKLSDFLLGFIHAAVLDQPRQQAAAQQRPAKKDKKAAEEKVEEKPAETETKSESDKTDAQ